MHKTYLKTLLLALVSGLIFSQTKADIVVPKLHNSVHSRLQIEQESALEFCAFMDSLTNELTLEEDDDPFADNSGIFADWDDEHVDPTRGKNTWKIPDTLSISMKGWVPPTMGRVTSPYGWRGRRMHKGVDLKVFVGDTIRSAFDGKVRIKKLEGIRKGYGYYLVVRHKNGFETVYGHLSKFLVDKDQEVKAGQPIALGGNTGRSTGPHLHLEFRVAGIAINPADIINFETFEPKNQIYAFKHQQVKKEVERMGGTQAAAAYHKVRKGDTLGGIARKYRTSVSRLCRLNGIRQTSTLRIGQRIRYK
ncbi:MAG: peptidoglycan DD-metalloendopeptidase family protein [Bacteroidales bacterium]|nr:peptidoglycan DD-metalloendopeptidase family protein [Bacteroidales bacterium]